MYSVLLTAMLATGSESPQFFGSHSQDAGCVGCSGCGGCAGGGGGVFGLTNFFRRNNDSGYGCSGYSSCSGCSGCSGCCGGSNSSGFLGIRDCLGKCFDRLFGRSNYGPSNGCCGAASYAVSCYGGMGGMSSYPPMTGSYPPAMSSYPPMYYSAASQGGCLGGPTLPGYDAAPQMNGSQAVPPLTGGEPPLAAVNTATVVITLPADAKLFVDDQPLDLTGPSRVFRTPALEPGREYFYELRADVDRGGKTVPVRERVAVQAGKVARVTLPEPQLPANTARIHFKLPAGAAVAVEGLASPAGATVIQTPPLAAGQSYTYRVEATWLDGGTKRVEARDVRFAAGQQPVVDFTADAVASSK